MYAPFLCHYEPTLTEPILCILKQPLLLCFAGFTYPYVQHQAICKNLQVDLKIILRTIERRTQKYSICFFIPYQKEPFYFHPIFYSFFHHPFSCELIVTYGLVTSARTNYVNIAAKSKTKE